MGLLLIAWVQMGLCSRSCHCQQKSWGSGGLNVQLFVSKRPFCCPVCSLVFVSRAMLQCRQCPAWMAACFEQVGCTAQPQLPRQGCTLSPTAHCQHHSLVGSWISLICVLK